MKRLMLFVHYDRDGLLDEHVLYLLRALKPFRTECAVLVNGALSDADAARFTPVADRVIRRPNQGFDFGAWADGLQEYAPRLQTDFDSVLLVNGSCFGPLFSFEEMFDRMDRESCDFWGITEYSGTAAMPPHLQSYFLEIRKPMLLSAEFQKFFREIGAKCTSFAEAVRCGEVGFSRAMVQAGFRYRAYVQMEDLRQAPNAGILETFSYTSAPFLIRKYRLPLLKIKAFGQVPCSPIFRGSEIFRALRESGSSYPEHLIVDYLRRTAPLSWLKNLPETLLTVDRNQKTAPDSPAKFAVMFHCYFPEKADFLLPYLQNIPMDFDLLITSPKPETETILRRLTEALPHLQNFHFRQTVNRGRDVAPWLCGFSPEEHLQYDVVLKLHIKRSPQMPEAFCDQWQHQLYDDLAGSPAMISAVWNAFAAEPALGMVFPPYPPVVTLQCPTAYAGHPDDTAAGQMILKELHLDPPPETGMPVFSPGTMFYYRPRALKNLIQKPWSPDDFPPEPLPDRGTKAHAMERIVPYIAQANGFYFRHCTHSDNLAEAFRTYENRILYYAPTLKQGLRIFLQAAKDSLQYRLPRIFRVLFGGKS